MEETGFCCAGCSYVYRLVHEHGFDGYYAIKDAITTPADASVFQPRDFAWLEAVQRAAEVHLSGGAVPELTLDVQGISCAGCVWLIERVFAQQPGARDIEANAQLGQLRLRWVPGEFTAADFARKLQGFGYLLGPAGDDTTPPESRALLKKVGLCAAFAMNVMLYALPAYFGLRPTDAYAGLFGWLAMAFATMSFLVGGTYFVARAFRTLRERALHIDLPIALGIVGAYAGSVYGWLAGQERLVYFDFVSTFILLMLVGRWAQVAAVERNQRRLLKQQPKPSRLRLVAGGEVPPEQLATGQAFHLSSGQTLPVDARLDAPEAAFSLASINGEADPRVFRRGQRIPAGAVNVGRDALIVVALQPWSESLLARLLHPAARAGARHVFLEKIIRGYLLGIIGVAVIAGCAWWWLSHDALRTGTVVTAVLVVSCPCAIGLAFPLADEIATVALRRRGVFVRTDDLWPKLARIRHLVFDKTGTLTLETPVLRNPEALHALGPEARAALHLLVRDNPHPLSQCLLEQLLADPASRGLETDAPHPGPEVRETVGYGVETVGLSPGWSLGRPGWRTAADDGASPAGETGGGSDMELVCAGRPLARFRFADTARPDARAEIAALQARGYSVHLLSGDRDEKVAALAQEVGIPASRAHAALSPQDKSDWFAQHDQQDTMMLGDGANDTLAFDRAFCRGTPVIHRGILEQRADFYYLGRGIGGLRALFEVNAIRRRAQWLILVFSVVYNAVAVGLAVAGHMNPLVAAIMMPANSLITLALVIGSTRRAFSA
jgi:Cu2+-exporting ATPase